MADKNNAYHQLLVISDQLKRSSYERKIVEEKYVFRDFVRNDTGLTTAAVKNMEFACMALNALDGLSKPAKLFVVNNLVPAICTYNLLWHWPTPRKSSEKMVLKELVDAKLIFRTETVGMYLVNPIRVWRGQLLTCVEATKDLLRSAGRATPDLVRDLRPGDKYTHKTGGDDFNLLNDITDKP